MGGVCHGRNRPSFLLFQLIRSFLWGQLVHGSQQKLTGEEKMGHVVLPEQAGNNEIRTIWNILIIFLWGGGWRA